MNCSVQIGPKPKMAVKSKSWMKIESQTFIAFSFWTWVCKISFPRALCYYYPAIFMAFPEAFCRGALTCTVFADFVVEVVVLFADCGFPPTGKAPSRTNRPPPFATIIPCSQPTPRSHAPLLREAWHPDLTTLSVKTPQNDFGKIACFSLGWASSILTVVNQQVKNN